MRHEKVFKRDDGSKVRLTVELNVDFGSSKPRWYLRCDTCNKGKRTWLSTVEDDYFFRKLSHDGKRQHITKVALLHVSENELTQTMEELWQQLKPSVSHLD
jgi:hypothetical protein